MKRGFSLLETVLATFIMSLITMAVFNIFPSSVMAVKRGEVELQADAIAQQILEEHRAKPFEELVIGPAIALPQVTLGGTVFRPGVRVFEVGSGANAANPDHLKAVRATVDWTHSSISHSLAREAWILSLEE